MQVLKHLITGLVIGVANIIPGVSGGTMALIMGIYERLITAIHNISSDTVFIFFKSLTFSKDSYKKLKYELKRIDAGFLMCIAAGAITAVISLAKIMTILLNDYHDPTYGFFFGLVLLTAVAPYRLIKKKTAAVGLSVMIAFAGVIGVSASVSGDALIEKAKVKLEMKQAKDINTSAYSENTVSNTSRSTADMIHLFFMGAVAISAMILPGVSGSFLLLLMGGYFDILRAISERDLAALSIFAAGCILGLALFTRLLDYLLKRWHDITMGFLLGLVTGSLWMIWPFKTTAVVGEETIYLSNRIPAAFGSAEIYTLLSVLAGMLVVGVLLAAEKRFNEV